MIVEPTNDAIECAANRLRMGDIVAFPTETVYGLGADTFNPVAIDAVYALKGRPANNPLIAHVIDDNQVNRLTSHWNDMCQMLADSFWPGSLTIVVHRADEVPSASTAGLPTIAIRSPAHPVARQLIEAFDSPISAPSANRSGHVSPTTAQHVADDFSDHSRHSGLLILDGGACICGLESTIVDMTTTPVRLLRPGAVTLEHLQRVLGDIEDVRPRSQDIAPGTSLRHYAPRKPVRVFGCEELQQFIANSDQSCVILGIDCDSIGTPHQYIAMPRDAKKYANRIYAALREADSGTARMILIERPPLHGSSWQAVHDRLRRATS